MNEFDIHAGHISESYRELWGHINPVFLTLKQSTFRSTLRKAIQAVSYSRNLYEPLASYMTQYPDVGYILNSENPIRIDENIHQLADTWLLSFASFEYDGNVYQWAPDISLMQQDEYFDTFFALKWAAVDVIQGDEFLSYQQQQGNWSDTKIFVRYLRKLIIKYPDTLPSSKFDRLVNEYTNLDDSGQTVADAGLKSIQIKLPKVPPRRNGDDKTTLGQKETAKLFTYLRHVGVILKDTSYLSESNVHKAIQVLTGYNDTNLRKSVVSASISKTELKNLRNTVNRIITLIDMDLAVKKDHKK